MRELKEKQAYVYMTMLHYIHIWNSRWIKKAKNPNNVLWYRSSHSQYVDCMFLLKSVGVSNSWEKLCHCEETQILPQARAKLHNHHDQSCGHYVSFQDLIKKWPLLVSSSSQELVTLVKLRGKQRRLLLLTLMTVERGPNGPEASINLDSVPHWLFLLQPPFWDAEPKLSQPAPVHLTVSKNIYYIHCEPFLRSLEES